MGIYGSTLDEGLLLHWVSGVFDWKVRKVLPTNFRCRKRSKGVERCKGKKGNMNGNGIFNYKKARLQFTMLVKPFVKR